MIKLKFSSYFVLMATVLSVAVTGCKEGSSTQTDKTEKTSTKSTSSKYDAQINELLAKMSPEEKAGQMTQINLNKILVNDYSDNDGEISDSLLDIVVGKKFTGSLLNAINHAYPLEQWHSIIKKIQDKALSTGNKIPVIYGIDAIHGTTFTLGSTLFPHNIGIAATRNPAIAKEGAKITAKEVRASGIRWNFDPVFDIGKMPLWPRFPETYGEDPYLIEQMGVAVVEGYEEDGLDKTTAVASCMKHFIGYSASRTGRDRTPSYIPELELREYYLPQFQAAVNAGASTIMINSGEVNGIPVHGNKYLLTTILRDELGFKGLVVTDWEDINRLHQRHMTSPTMKDAVKTAIMAGVDMSMTPHDFMFTDIVVELIKEGDKEFIARVDESVKRVLRLKFELGLFENPYVEESAIAQFGQAEYGDAALKAALESMTLLKNDNKVLPLAKGSKILLAGPNANNIPSLHGCWSYSWQGAEYTRSWTSNKGEAVNMKLYPESTKSIKEALEATMGAGNVICKSVMDYEAAANYTLGSVSGVDAVVLALGENAYAESPGSIKDLTLDARQIALAKAAVKSGKPVIVVLVEGRPRVINAFADDVDGILQAYWPGSKGAEAIAKTLVGEYNPGGKLPYSYPRFTGDFVTYDHHWTEVNVEEAPGVFTDNGYNPQFAFGHGLSYSKFEYSNFALSADTIKGDAKLKVTIDVKNTSTVDGDEVVELYIRDMYASSVPALKRLKKFERVNIKAGENKTVTFEIAKKDLQIAKVDTDTRKYSYVTEDGDFKVMIGGLGFELEQPKQPWEAYLSRTYKEAKSFYYSN